MLDRYRIHGSRLLLPFFFFLFIALAFHAEKLVSGRGTPITLHDEFDHEYSRYLKTGELLYEHGLFAWYPSLAGGSPSYAYQFPPYYPLCFLAPVVPLWLIYSSLTMAWMCLAGLGMYLFLKERLSVSKDVALAGGVIFSIGVEIYGCGVTQTVFDYCFPLFYVLMTQQTHRRWVLWSSGAVLCLLTVLSYPVLTLPIYMSMHFVVLLLLEGKESLKIFKVHVKRWAIYWSGYVLSCLPLIYTLFLNKDNASRQYGAFTERMASLVGQQLWGNASRTMLMFVLGGSLCFITKSKRVGSIFRSVPIARCV